MCIYIHIMCICVYIYAHAYVTNKQNLGVFWQGL